MFPYTLTGDASKPLASIERGVPPLIQSIDVKQGAARVGTLDGSHELVQEGNAKAQ